jgi:hypothetical protein
MSPEPVPTAGGPDVLPNPIPEPDPEPPEPDPTPEPAPVPPMPEPAPAFSSRFAAINLRRCRVQSNVDSPARDNQNHQSRCCAHRFDQRIYFVHLGN